MRSLRGRMAAVEVGEFAHEVVEAAVGGRQFAQRGESEERDPARPNSKARWARSPRAIIASATRSKGSIAFSTLSGQEGSAGGARPGRPRPGKAASRIDGGGDLGKPSSRSPLSGIRSMERISAKE